VLQRANPALRQSIMNHIDPISALRSHDLASPTIGAPAFRVFSGFRESFVHHRAQDSPGSPNPPGYLVTLRNMGLL
jgi:hypothetical protein